jgi:hypothetical protein
LKKVQIKHSQKNNSFGSNRGRNKRRKKKENYSDDDVNFRKNLVHGGNYPGAVDMEDASHLNESKEGEDE